MSVTPVPNSRLMSPAFALKLTPSNSPFAKGTSAKSPIKSNRNDSTLSLRQVIGTTVASPNSFDGLPNSNSFAFTAGAAAVIATVDEKYQVSQRFFRARPTTAPINTATSAYGPSTPNQNPNDSRIRTPASIRESGIGLSLGSPTAEWGDAAGGKSWTARDRVKTATCVSFSPDGKYLAVGETGNKPRVLIFSTALDAPSDYPLTSIYDHTFGVRCVAFSPDSQLLASLGAANDGFLYIWNVNPRNGSTVFYASNKCTSNITRIAWLGQNLITIGTRHVKVWRTEEVQVFSPTKSRMSDFGNSVPGSMNKTLQGRNCLLGPLLECTFTSVIPISASKAVICTSRGDICLLDDTEGAQRLFKIADAGFGVNCSTVSDDGRLHLTGAQGTLKILRVDDLLATRTPPQSPGPVDATEDAALASDTCHIEAITSLKSCLVSVDSEHHIKLLRLPTDDGSSVEVIRQLPAHSDAVLGVDALPLPNKFDASFFTWSADGAVLFWDQGGYCKGDMKVELTQPDDVEDDRNELKVVRASRNADFFACGDKVGLLRIVDGKTKKTVFTCKAHAAEVTDVTIHEESNALVGCSSRDRTLQVFEQREGTWELLQTMDEHVGAVTSLLFSKNGTRLISSSSDRTIVVREKVSLQEGHRLLTAFVILRTITLKATPLSIILDPNQDDAIIVSTIDRQVHQYDIETGQVITSFRATDTEGGDAVALSGLVTVPRRGATLTGGISSTDKSVRLYNESGSLIKRDWGHTEGITGITLVSTSEGEETDMEQKSLVTVAADGTIFIWDLDRRQQQLQELTKSMDLMGLSPVEKDKKSSRPPLRRVLSQSELARFQRSSTEDAQTPTQTGSRSPRLRKKSSKFSLAQAPRLDPPSSSANLRGGYSTPEIPTRRSFRNRSPSPPSPRSKVEAAKIAKMRRSSNDLRSRAKPMPTTYEFGSLGNSTEQVCRTLRAYRKKLGSSSDNLTTEQVRELERELALTARAVGEKAIQSRGMDERVMAKLLDQYSNRLVEMLDEKIAERVAQQVRKGSEVNSSDETDATRERSDSTDTDTIKGVKDKGEIGG
ncbi:WD repeat protein-like protein [Pseudovirgaria hyperparasitica]|uniref:WD repeat protein-like protein n=1 Tax=Pseudovirgaria hyperparasitica TaxID=470096 RepID=A0A6A6WHA8_9PEZI|nr:WD repeat protein-like protein [Pseudovirgaria hyperparasitica]KAF2762193.1 WD repeat protein-like protein [Pseudovirgaria hyperparasitica]